MAFSLTQIGQAVRRGQSSYTIDFLQRGQAFNKVKHVYIGVAVKSSTVTVSSATYSGVTLAALGGSRVREGITFSLQQAAMTDGLEFGSLSIVLSDIADIHVRVFILALDPLGINIVQSRVAV